MSDRNNSENDSFEQNQKYTAHEDQIDTKKQNEIKPDSQDLLHDSYVLYDQQSKRLQSKRDYIINQQFQQQSLWYSGNNFQSHLRQDSYQSSHQVIFPVESSRITNGDSMSVSVQMSGSDQIDQNTLPNQDRTTRRVHQPLGWPGESKNIAKNFIRCLQTFITSYIQFNGQPPEPVQKFLKLTNKNSGKHKLEMFMKTQVGRIICREFFGNCQFAFLLIKENKTSPEQYEKFCQDYYYKYLE